MARNKAKRDFARHEHENTAQTKIFMAIKPKPAKPGNAKAKRRIFVVEDHPVFREGLVRLITAEKDLMVCGQATDGVKALKSISDLKPDLALIDLGLPGKSGLGLIKDVRARKLPVKLLVVSMYDEAIYAQRVLRAGGDGYIMKQEDPAEIVNAIRDVLAGRIYVSEEVMASGAAKPPEAGSTDPAESISKLTDSELEILEMLGEGQSNEEIASRFHLTADEVSANCVEIQNKLDLKCINALIRYAVCWIESSNK